MFAVLLALDSFSRRIYQNKGPNYLIHVDGYDKLKRFGIAVHGAVDGWVVLLCRLNADGKSHLGLSKLYE